MTKHGLGTVLMRVIVGGQVVSEAAFHPAPLSPPMNPYQETASADVEPYNSSAWYNHWANRIRRERRY